MKYFSELGIPAPGLQAPLAAGAEFLCGGLVLAGLATRVAARPLIIVMTVALSTALADQIREPSDLFALAEFCYIVLLAELAISGPGPVSIDAIIARRFEKNS